MRDLHELPKLRDSLSYLYLEHAIINQSDLAIEATTDMGRTMVPIANLSVLMLGPGTSITHAAVRALADNGCSVVWVGEDGMRCYAHGSGETRKAYRLLHQAYLVSHPELREQVVLNMYHARFGGELDRGLTLPQIRGKEGVRVRTAYARASRTYGVKWDGRRYDRSKWERADPINRALSAANALLNGLCHAAIVSGGYSPGLGFIHTGRQFSFVYDIADLYKIDITIPVAFETVAKSKRDLEARVRQACRERFREEKLLERILPDIDRLLDLKEAPYDKFTDADSEHAPPGTLWEALEGEV
ncbi:MAG TPA: type I-E CRISPR-associated endonuclease Cas1e [Aggregatilineales bacterium]|nr:type I-E CRISPR-associated endonuclease Cas1 [Chloroflexota bacterium]HQA68654.1 type I-E CRISPR-associated endonuclease Cas1e [Aggregatilineales bacterium]HQE17756.1 type I-E CRISPR-associated endonuclease Cas1e [Aggregatilineales bacterium]